MSFSRENLNIKRCRGRRLSFLSTLKEESCPFSPFFFLLPPHRVQPPFSFGRLQGIRETSTSPPLFPSTGDQGEGKVERRFLPSFRVAWSSLSKQGKRAHGVPSPPSPSLVPMKKGRRVPRSFLFFPFHFISLLRRRGRDSARRFLDVQKGTDGERTFFPPPFPFPKSLPFLTPGTGFQKRRRTDGFVPFLLCGIQEDDLMRTPSPFPFVPFLRSSTTTGGVGMALSLFFFFFLLEGYILLIIISCFLL